MTMRAEDFIKTSIDCIETGIKKLFEGVQRNKENTNTNSRFKKRSTETVQDENINIRTVDFFKRSFFYLCRRLCFLSPNT